MKILFLLILSAAFYPAYSQSNVYYHYDASGNQILRDVVCVTCGRYAKPAEKETILSVEELVAYPNPVTKLLTVKWQNDSENPVQSILLYDANGRRLYQYSVKDRVGEIKIPFSTYSPGAYILAGRKKNKQVVSFNIIKP